MSARLSPDEFAWAREVYHEGNPPQRRAALAAVLAHFSESLGS